MISLPGACARSNPPANEPGKPAPFNVASQFLAIRADVLGVVRKPFDQPTQAMVQKAAAWLADVDVALVPNIEPALRLALEHVKAGAPGWNAEGITGASFLWGAFVSKWPDLLEELDGNLPKVVKSRTGPAVKKWKIQEA
jgi:hypothetical protein